MMSDIKKTSSRFKQVFGSPEGKEVLKHLLNFCGVLRASYVPRDALCTARNEGRREVGLEIIKFIHMKEEDIDALIKANYNLEDF